MISEDSYEESSGDLGVDFARLETKFRAKLQQNLDLSDNNYSFNSYSIE